MPIMAAPTAPSGRWRVKRTDASSHRCRREVERGGRVLTAIVSMSRLAQIVQELRAFKPSYFEQFERLNSLFSLVPYARIYECINQIHKKVDKDKDEGREQHQTLHHGVVSLTNGLDEELADAV
jgi:hypothetical protein